MFVFIENGKYFLFYLYFVSKNISPHNVTIGVCTLLLFIFKNVYICSNMHQTNFRKRIITIRKDIIVA